MSDRTAGCGMTDFLSSNPLRALLERMAQWDQFNPPMTGDHAHWKREIDDALAADEPKPAPKATCACGDPYSGGGKVVHRPDLPCYWLDPPCDNYRPAHAESEE